MKIFSLLMLFLITLSSSVFAELVWETNGSGCVPTDQAVQDSQSWNITDHGSLQYTGSGGNPLIFSCSVNNADAHFSSINKNVITLYYRDPDGAGDDFKIEAHLKSRKKSNGILTELCSTVSDQAGEWEYTSVGDCGRLDFINNFYWFEVVISGKGSGGKSLEFNGLTLER